MSIAVRLSLKYCKGKKVVCQCSHLTRNINNDWNKIDYTSFIAVSILNPYEITYLEISKEITTGNGWGNHTKKLKDGVYFSWTFENREASE